jgi:methylenetetrahydrofolate dehydrogenase (NADP+)/methenyltetrahydrofolate cyclohydrolase
VEKDVDGILGTSSFLPPVTPIAIKSLLSHYDIQIKGKSILIIGNGPLVGLPLSQMLLKRGEAATIVSCTKDTHNLMAYTLNADIIITAAGCPNLLTKDMIKSGAVIIDCSINRITIDGKNRIVGDSNEDVHEKASYMTPVPGGVGPVAVATLI